MISVKQFLFSDFQKADHLLAFGGKVEAVVAADHAGEGGDRVGDLLRLGGVRTHPVHDVFQFVFDLLRLAAESLVNAEFLLAVDLILSHELLA